MRQTKYYSVYLPCKKYIFKYVSSLYGTPFIANNKTALGCYINSCLEKNTYIYRELPQSFIYTHFTEKLSIHLSGWQFSHIGHDFSNEKIISVNRFIENLFEEHLYQWCDVRGKPGIERKQLIEQFAEKHLIETEVDISLHALVKMEYRKRKSIEKNSEITAARFPLFR